MIGFTLGDVAFVGGLVKGGDPYFSNVNLLVHGTGSSGSTIVDSSSGSRAVTVVGNAQISTAQSKFGGSSIFFDGSGDYLTLPSGSDWDFGSGDFTLELWAWTNVASGSKYLITRRNASGGYTPFQVGLSGLSVVFRASSNNSSWDIADNAVIGTLVQFAWNYVAVRRIGNQFTGAVNNSVVNLATSSNALMSTTRPLYIGGSQESGTFSLNGFMQEVRITKGVGRDLSVPIAPFPDF